ncbi:MAG: hypothetical protein ACI8Y6_001493 [Brevundimonas sp.]|jgi:hypothetical protein
MSFGMMLSQGASTNPLSDKAQIRLAFEIPGAGSWVKGQDHDTVVV